MGGESHSTPDVSSEHFRRAKAKISQQELPSFLMRSA